MEFLRDGQSEPLAGVFTTGEARAAGVRADRLPGIGAAIRLTRGVYADFASAPLSAITVGIPGGELAASQVSFGSEPSAGDAEHPGATWCRNQVEWARLLSRKLPDGVFYSHHTAAALWGIPVVPRANDRLDIGVYGRSHGSRKDAFRSHRFAPDSVRVVSLGGAPVTDPASTWVTLAARLPRQAAVALGDAVLYAPRYPGTARLKRLPLARPEEIHRLVTWPRRPARRILTDLAAQLSHQAASPPETHLRLMLSEWGLPAPKLDFDVCDERGRLLGCSELAFAESRLALEYEGDHHRIDTRQWNRDIEKYRAYAENGWEVLRVTAQLLYREQSTLRAQVEEALARRS